MSRKITTAQSSFRILVANLAGGGDPSRGINPTILRSQFEMQHFPQIAGRGQERGPGAEDPHTPGVTTHVGLLAGTATPWVPTESGGIVTVTNNDFSSPASLYLGNYILISGEHYAVGIDATATATNLAAAIDSLDEFGAASGGAIVLLTGPIGPDGNAVRFEASYQGAVQNFTLTLDTGRLDGAQPFIGPFDIS